MTKMYAARSIEQTKKLFCWGVVPISFGRGTHETRRP